jgi:hypothetical protein
MRTTVTLDPDVYAAARALAESSRRSLGAIVSELARRGLRPPRGPAKATGPSVFTVSKGALRIPGNRATDLLAEEGQQEGQGKGRGKGKKKGSAEAE